MSALRRTTPPPPVRILHLGLGNFFRAHQAWYTANAPDCADWGIAAFAGRSARLAGDLQGQDGLYTLVTRDAGGDQFDVIASVAAAHDGDDLQAWRAYFADPQVALVTITVTEAGYLRGGDGGLDMSAPDVAKDVAALKGSSAAPVSTAPAKLVAGLLARRASGGGAIAVVPCDNLMHNGALVERVVTDMAAAVDPSLLGFISEQVSFVTTMVDRITPRTTDPDRRQVRQETGVDDAAPVVTEPFSEWVLSGVFPAGRPAWEKVGATITDDVAPYEQRKLWLLNGAHSLLAYAGSARGHETVAEAINDLQLRDWVEQWWAVASPYLSQPKQEVAQYRSALLQRFSNPRMRHLLAQIAADGSQKLPVRILPTLVAEREAGRLPEAATRVLAAWVAHLRGAGAPVQDPRAGELKSAADGPLPEAVRSVLGLLAPQLATDDAVVDAVARQVPDITRPASPS